MRYTRLVPEKLVARAEAHLPRRPWRRARSIPATGLQLPGTGRRKGTVVSLAAHALLLFLLLRPEAPNTNPELVEIEQGGGGPGPAGGGGGGTGGTGGVRYVKLPPPPSVPPPITPVLPPLVVEPPKPVVPEPVLPAVEMPKLTPDTKVEIKPASPIVGIGGGTGRDGTTGTGPGTGGGTGSGVGTGRGSGIGPGTGGGNLDHYAPTLIEMPLLPLPAPPKVRGFKLIAIFDIDERGKILNVEFTGTKDGDYNRKLSALFKTFRFRPGTTLDGVPIRAKYQFGYEF